MTRDKTAALVGISGAVGGMAAGLAAAVWGTGLGAWAGDKQDPVPLGLLTVAVSALAAAVSVGLLRMRTGPGPGPRAAVAAGQLLPGLLGFTTVGRLWWIPGALLLLASAATVSVAPKAVAQAVRHRWSAVLTGVLGACLVLVAAPAAPPVLALATISGVLVATAPWAAARPRWTAPALLVAGAVPFAALTWWTLVTPLIAVLALAAGSVALHRRADA